MIQLVCACGAQLDVLEVYAGGHVICHVCGGSVQIPADIVAANEKIRFHCPHCNRRVVAKRSSAGKKSNCPACSQPYVVPEPPQETDLGPEPDSRRIRLDDELPMFPTFPFPVGKLDTRTPPAPRPRYLHTPEEVEAKHDGVGPILIFDESRHGPMVSTPEHLEPDPSKPDRPTPDRSAPEPSMPDRSIPHRIPTVEAPLTPARPASVQVLEHDQTREFDTARREAALTINSPAFSSVANSIPTAAAIPQIHFSTKPASVGELEVIGGSSNGQRIRMDFHHFVVGYERDCDLRPSSEFLSRHHCVFKKDEYALRVRDLGSRYGTFVNGRRIFGEVVLNPGDEVRVGDVKLFVILPRSPEVTRIAADSHPSLSDFVIL